MLRAALSLLVPSLCPLCRRACGRNEAACAGCVERITATRGGLLSITDADAAWAATAYEETGRLLVSRLKFDGRLALADVAARAIAAAVPAPPRAAEVVPVPADPWRLRLRGFDPAAAIAVALAREWGLATRECLARTHARRQVGRTRDERVADGPQVRPVAEPPVLAVLVDDVVTTGTTLAAAASALREGGCAEILAVAFARA